MLGSLASWAATGTVESATRRKASIRSMGISSNGWRRRKLVTVCSGGVLELLDITRQRLPYAVLAVQTLEPGARSVGCIRTN